MDKAEVQPLGRWYGRVAAVLIVASAALASPATAAPEPRCARSVERVESGTWAMAPIAGIEGAYPGWRMAADPADPGLAVVADSAGVLVSRDAGCRWTRALTFDDIAPEWSLRAEDVEIAHGPRGRSLHVLALAGANARVLLLSSHDDGRTWLLTEPPVEATGSAPAKVRLAVDPSRSGRLYLLVQHWTTHGALLSTDDAGTTWRWAALTTHGAPSGTCFPIGACIAPPLLQVEAAGADEVWALTAAVPNQRERVVHSTDAGSSWSDVGEPALGGGPYLLDVAPAKAHRAVLLLGSVGKFALSRDGGASWAVGEFPTVSSGPDSTQRSFDAAHTSGGRAFATLLGSGPGRWSGNLMLFRGREWVNVAPDAYAGFDRKDDEGNSLFFTELVGGRDSFSMLSSRGLLATFLPRR